MFCVLVVLENTKKLEIFILFIRWIETSGPSGAIQLW